MSLAAHPVTPSDEGCRDRCMKLLLWERYLYEDHTRKQLAQFARRLRVFRFCRAYGGHAGDGDCLKSVLRLADEAQLLATCAALGIPLKRMPPAERYAALPYMQQPWTAKNFPAGRSPDGCWLPV